jgi:hypothetical protein
MMSASVGLRKRRAIPAWPMAVEIAFLFLAIVGYAKATGQWNINLAAGIPRASAECERTATSRS